MHCARYPALGIGGCGTHVNDRQVGVTEPVVQLLWRPEQLGILVVFGGHAVTSLDGTNESVCRDSWQSGATITPARICPRSCERDEWMSSIRRGEGRVKLQGQVALRTVA